MSCGGQRESLVSRSPSILFAPTDDITLNTHVSMPRINLSPRSLTQSGDEVVNRRMLNLECPARLAHLAPLFNILAACLRNSCSDGDVWKKARQRKAEEALAHLSCRPHRARFFALHSHGYQDGIRCLKIVTDDAVVKGPSPQQGDHEDPKLRRPGLDRATCELSLVITFALPQQLPQGGAVL